MATDDKALVGGAEITREDVSPEFLGRRPGFRASRGGVHPEVARDREIKEEWERIKAAHLAEQRKRRRHQYRRSLYHEPQSSWGDHLGDVSDDWVPRYLAASEREQKREDQEAADRFSLSQEWIDSRLAAGTSDLEAAWEDYYGDVHGDIIKRWHEALEQMDSEGEQDTGAYPPPPTEEQDTGAYPPITPHDEMLELLRVKPFPPPPTEQDTQREETLKAWGDAEDGYQEVPSRMEELDQILMGGMLDKLYTFR